MDDLKVEEQLALVDSDNRPALKRFLAGTRAVVTATFKSLLDACHQTDHRHPDFTESRWPLEPVAVDEADWEVVEHYLTKTGTLNRGVKHLEKLADKGEIRMLVGSRRAMEYIARHQKAQLDHPIILPLRARDSSDDWCLPVFRRNWCSWRRELDLDGTGNRFPPHYGWLVIKRKQK